MTTHAKRSREKRVIKIATNEAFQEARLVNEILETMDRISCNAEIFCNSVNTPAQTVEPYPHIVAETSGTLDASSRAIDHMSRMCRPFSIFSESERRRASILYREQTSASIFAQ